MTKIGVQGIAATLYAEFLETLGDGRYSLGEVQGKADAFLAPKLLAYPKDKRDLIRDSFFDCDDEKQINDTRGDSC